MDDAVQRFNDKLDRELGDRQGPSVGIRRGCASKRSRTGGRGSRRATECAPSRPRWDRPGEPAPLGRGCAVPRGPRPG